MEKILGIFLFLLILSALFTIILFFSRSAISTKGYSIDVAGLKRSYRVHLPKGYDKNKKYPLLIVLHALGDGPILIELNSGFSRKADKEGFIAIYPKGTGMRLSWNAGFCCGYALENKIDDIEFIRKMIYEVRKDFSVDEAKIFTAGLSNGGMMTYRIASEIPQIKAIAVVAATLGSDKKKLNPPKPYAPLLVIHGEKDNLIPYNGGGQYNFLSVAESIKTWTNGDTSKTTLNLVKNRGHLWFGGLQDYIINRQIPKFSATDAIWNFFKER